MQQQFYQWNGPRIWASQERRGAFRTANWIGGALLTGLITAIFMSIVYGAFLTFTGRLTPSGESSVYVDDQLFYIFFSVGMFVPFSVLAAVICRRPMRDVFRFERHSPALALALVLLTVGACALGNFATDLLYLLMDQAGHPPYMPDQFEPTEPFGLTFVLLTTAAVPALTEEFCFRGMVLGLLRPYGNKLAIVASAVLFALMHGNLIQIPFALIVGLALGYAAVRSGSLWPGVLAHGLNNAVSVLLSYVSRDMSADRLALINWLYYMVCIGLGVIGLCWVIHRNRVEWRPPQAPPAPAFGHDRSADWGIAPPAPAVRRGFVNIADPYPHMASLGQRIGMICASPTLIVFALYCLFSTLQYIT